MSSDRIERATPADLTLLASDVGPAPMQIGAVLRLSGGLSVDPQRAVDAIGDRIVAIPRLRQRLRPTPPGCGRPVWVEHAGFRLEQHVTVLPCPAPGDEPALLDLAARVIGTPLPADRPRWRLTVVPGLQGGDVALVVAFHHLLTDGIGGLAVLAALVDGPPGSASPALTEPPDRPRGEPSRRELAAEAWRARFRGLRLLPDRLRRLRAAVSQLRPRGSSTSAPRCSLNRPTGASRRLAVVRLALADVVAVAHVRGASVNDVVLTAVSGALHSLLRSRHEEVGRLVVSVPVSGRTTTSAGRLGNEVGAVPVELPVSGDPLERLQATATATRRAKDGWRGASDALLGPAFRLLAALRMFRPFVERQHLVNTFVTNLRGPDERLSLLGSEIADVIAVALVPGNVSVSFAVLSYAGTLAVTVVADPDTCPDLDHLRGALEEQFDLLHVGVVRPDDGR